MNQVENTIKTLEALGYRIYFSDQWHSKDLPANEAHWFSIGEPESLAHHFKMIKNLDKFTPEYVLSKLSQKESMKIDWGKLLSGVCPCSQFYPTTYGFGMFCLFGSDEKATASKLAVSQFLEQMGVEYKNEYSDARWVYRFVISKSKQNLEKLSRIKKDALEKE